MSLSVCVVHIYADLCLPMGSGCGLNILNEPPIGSLAQLEALAHGQETLTVERVTAAVLTKFERMWNVFITEDGFRPFIDRYTQSWLHS